MENKRRYKFNPATHVCDIGTIDYSHVDDEQDPVIKCKGCGRRWTRGFKGWSTYPPIFSDRARGPWRRPAKPSREAD